MAIARFHMRKDGLMIEHDSREFLERIRKENPELKFARIRHVIQMYPSLIEIGKFYLLK